MSKMFEFTAELDKNDIKLLNLELTRIGGRAGDLRPVFEHLRPEYVQEVEKRFKSQGSYSGKGWPRLKLSTLKDRKRKGYPPGPILVRSGALRDSLVSNTMNTINTVRRKYWEYGSRIPYAIYHQSTRPRRKLPRRAFLFISNKFRLRTIRAFHSYVVTGKVSTGEI